LRVLEENFGIWWPCPRLLCFCPNHTSPERCTSKPLRNHDIVTKEVASSQSLSFVSAAMESRRARSKEPTTSEMRCSFQRCDGPPEKQAITRSPPSAN
jgi:hypothetical protein